MSDNNCDPNANVTTADNAEAWAFATARTLEKFCSDPGLKKLLCTTKTGESLNDQNCVTWKKDNSLKKWRDVTRLIDKECTTDDNCKENRMFPSCIAVDGENKKYCGFSSTTEFNAGRCEFITEEACMANSELPYKCDADGCKNVDPAIDTSKTNQIDCQKTGKIWAQKDPDDASKGAACYENQLNYLEWRTNDLLTCDSQINLCKNPQSCKNGTCQCKTDDDCWGSGKCTGGVCKGGGRCVMGNHYLREWCENPIFRCQPNDDGSYPPECSGSSTEVGITDVPPFYYDSKAGKCYMTPEYCSRFNLKYVTSETKSCTSNVDCPSGLCDIAGTKKCVSELGKCDDSMYPDGVTGFLANMTIGKTLFELIKNKGSCSKENWEWLDLNKIPDEITECVDPKYIHEKELIKKDLIPGVNLYLIHWKRSALNTKFSQKITPLASIGFLGNEIKKKFPSIIKKRDGVLFVQMKKKNLSKDDKHLKTIYFYIAKKEHLLAMFETNANAAQVKLSPEERNFILQINKSL